MFDFVEYKKNFLQATKDWNNEKWNNFDDNPFLLSAPMLQDCHVKNCRFVESRLKILELNTGTLRKKFLLLPSPKSCI
jgi:hypothetical protein